MRRLIVFAVIVVVIIVVFIVVRKWLKRRWDASIAFQDGIGSSGGGQRRGFKPDNAKVPSKKVILYNKNNKKRKLMRYIKNNDFDETDIEIPPGGKIGVFDPNEPNAIRYFNDPESSPPKRWTMLKVFVPPYADPFFYVPAEGVQWDTRQAPPVTPPDTSNNITNTAAEIIAKKVNDLAAGWAWFGGWTSPWEEKEIYTILSNLNDNDLKSVIDAYSNLPYKKYASLYALVQKELEPGWLSVTQQQKEQLLQRIKNLSP